MTESINHFSDEDLKSLAICSVDLNVPYAEAARVHLMSDKEAEDFKEYYRLYSMS